MQAFCLRCNVNSDIINCKEVKLKNGRTALQGNVLFVVQAYLG
ncbi:MAG: hypothetical protein CM1200mP38_3540 [Dehalococcoidia bacterium]|nr:MAG: hypothetical protein CM1200mP38_3540 [Dehalococcoidia bacterium]